MEFMPQEMLIFSQLFFTTRRNTSKRRLDHIQYAIGAGVVKMNIDTDTQWAFWDGVRA